jgi:hypothetical protein
MRSTFLFIVFGSLLLVACRQKVGQASVNYPSVIEITGSDSLTSPDVLKSIFQANRLEMNLYQWKNHWVLFGMFDDLQKTKEQLAQRYPNASIRLYDKAFYEFNRKQCDNQSMADEWEEIVMTANLAADTALQQEYMDYHARQQEQFPEVAQGFCNADFQRLLVFRCERQLMLIIRIPKGKTLDELNPKTTENNPRVDEWNAIMAKYQEGIEGTAPGETWVTLHPLTKQYETD